MSVESATPGEVAYMGYYDSSGGRSLVSGQTLPLWGALSPEIQRAWECAAAAVLQRPLSDVTQAVALDEPWRISAAEPQTEEC